MTNWSHITTHVPGGIAHHISRKAHCSKPRVATVETVGARDACRTHDDDTAAHNGRGTLVRNGGSSIRDQNVGSSKYVSTDGSSEEDKCGGRKDANVSGCSKEPYKHSQEPYRLTNMGVVSLSKNGNRDQNGGSGKISGACMKRAS